jgi:TonB family protein
MANPPSSLHPWPGALEPIPGPDYLAPTPAPKLANPDAVLTALREQIASRKKDPDVLFGAIAFASQVMTNSDGAALGMRRDGAVVCVGRSGESAPALGARLSESSGISGECLRTGRSLRCDDTESDPRVDAEVCRQLGLRSIAAVPVRSRVETVGILEVFSTFPNAFSEEHMKLLSGLAELADLADPVLAPVFDHPPSALPEMEAVVPEPSDSFPNRLSWLVDETKSISRRRYTTIAVGCALAVFLALGGWSLLRKSPANDVSAANAAAVQQPQEQTMDLQTRPASIKPTPARISSSSRRNSRERVVPASKVDFDEVVIHRIPVNSSSGADTSIPEPAAAATQSAPSTEAPEIPVMTAQGNGIAGVLSASVTVPKLDLPVSKGVTAAVLQRKVMPVYPRQARLLQREGAVQVRVRINDQGRIEGSKVIKGDPMLAQAVLEVLPQWRYQPASLNGKPIASETNLTVNFKLP